MSRKKTERVGQQRQNNQGLTMQIVKYEGNKKVKVKFLETYEQKWTTYASFDTGMVRADTEKYPVRIDGIKMKSAAYLAGSIMLIAVITFVLLIISLFK